VRLPSVTPAQIVVSRQIKKLFTGILDNPMVTFPPFMGKELNYLRAQISRITCNTHISPSSYFQTVEDEEEEEEEGGKGTANVLNFNSYVLNHNHIIIYTCVCNRLWSYRTKPRI